MSDPEAQATTDWIIPGAEGEAIRGTTHVGAEGPKATVLIAHGFKGYKDYGFLPLLAAALVERLPVVAHRFNFSHSGIGDDPATFQRPDLFERDTWDRQVEDLGYVAEAAHRGDLPETPAGLPIVLLGHNRGGVTCVLASGRREATARPAGIITMSSPDTCCSFDEATRAKIIEQGYVVSPSSRTGQDLRIGVEWLMSQVVAPKAHDVLACARELECPLLVIHGDHDITVPSEAAHHLSHEATGADMRLIEGGDHVFNTPNPADPDAPLSAQLASAIDASVEFIDERVIAGRRPIN
jgi:pimeloyl-ACP methyl ester carboxylesterase